MKARYFWLAIPGLMLAAALTMATACGDDDDDDDDDSSATYSEQCEVLIDEFLGGGGLFGDCFDDEVYRESLLEECPKFDTGTEIEESDPALACMENLNCDNYDDALGLFEALLDCMGPAIQE